MCNGNCIDTCDEYWKDWCRGASGALAEKRRLNREKSMNSFIKNYFPKLFKNGFELDFYELQDKYIISKGNFKVNYFPKSNRIYLFDEKKYYSNGKGWIKENLFLIKKEYKFTFGKYNGKTIEEVFNLEKEYLNWVLQKKINDTVVQQINKFLNK